MPSPNPARVPPTLRDQFMHVEYEHRCLAMAAYGSERFGLPSSDRAQSAAADRAVPGVSTILRVALLAHARNLIEFYCHSRSATAVHPRTGASMSPARDDDIVAEDFGVPSPPNVGALLGYRDEISVHVGHMCHWRDTGYRNAYAASQSGLARQRPEWDVVTTTLIDEVHEALTRASVNSDHQWQQRFAELHQECMTRRATGAWP